MAQAQCQFDIYFNLPNYVQDSDPTDAQNGIKFVSFINLEKRAKSTLKVNGGTCSLGQCGGPSSAGPEGCQCDDRCTELGDCCGDYAKSCQKVIIDGSVSILNNVEGGISFFSSAAGHSSCKGKCGGQSLDGKCMCDDRCHLTNDCCKDKEQVCPTIESNSVNCKCSGQSNAQLPAGQQGGPECNSPNDNPPGKWCYTNEGVCPDGQKSGSMTAQDWSVLACEKAASPVAGGGGAGGGGAGAKTCKCSPNLVNAAGAGGADCQSKDADGAWCYTEAGVCTDGKNSQALPGKQYSYKACEGVSAAKPTPPNGWTCAAAVYGARDTCDCNCGVRDPDCNIAGIRVTNCLGGQTCNAQGQCVNAAGPGAGGGGGGNTQVRGAKLGCTAGAPRGPSVGTRRNLLFLPRIVGGTAVNPPFKQTHLVSLQQANGNHFCGGSLIYDGTWVLTAAHCLQGKPYGQVPDALGQVVLHRHDFRVPLAQEGAEAFVAHRVYNHQAYNAATQANDIALIKLAKQGTAPNQPTIPLTRAEVPQNMKDNIIKLDDGSFAKEGQLLTVAGWGTLSSGGRTPPTAREVTVQYITQAKCQLKGGQAGNPNQYNGRIDTNSMMCAGQPNGAPGKDSCQGDSGGPLTTACMIGGKPRAVLVGVVSWGFGCALANLPGVYARVDAFIPWMQQVMGVQDVNSFNG